MSTTGIQHSSSDQSQSASTDFINNSNVPGGSIHFENPSDTLFADLFLSSGISWELCDRILSTIRNPSFNPKEITFKDCGDMFSCIGRKRDEAWSVVDARPRNNDTFPRVVLECVLEFIKEEMKKLRAIRRENIWNDLPEQWKTNNEESDWMTTLRNMLHVHSSWHASVRRVRGYAVSAKGPIPNLIQTPLYGGWTKELRLSYELIEEWSPFALGRSHGYLLNTLCTRIPNTRLAVLSFPKVERFPDSFIATLRNGISTLAALEELTFETTCVHSLLQALSTAVSETRHPSLRVLRFYIHEVEGRRLESGKLPAILSPLAPLQRLHSVHLRYKDYHGYRIPQAAVSGASWSHVSSKPGYAAFVVDELRVHCPSEWGAAEAIEVAVHDNTIAHEMLQAARFVEFRVDERSLCLDVEPVVVPSSIANAVAPSLGLCTSARKLVFRGFAWTRMKMFEQMHALGGVPSSVEELTIIAVMPLRPNYNWRCSLSRQDKRRAKAQMALNDVEMAKALAQGLAPGLRALTVCFTDGWYERFISEYITDGEGEPPLNLNERILPHCSKVCSERDINFYLNGTY